MFADNSDYQLHSVFIHHGVNIFSSVFIQLDIVLFLAFERRTFSPENALIFFLRSEQENSTAGENSELVLGL